MSCRRTDAAKLCRRQLEYGERLLVALALLLLGRLLHRLRRPHAVVRLDAVKDRVVRIRHKLARRVRQRHAVLLQLGAETRDREDAQRVAANTDEAVGAHGSRQVARVLEHVVDQRLRLQQVLVSVQEPRAGRERHDSGRAVHCTADDARRLAAEEAEAGVGQRAVDRVHDCSQKHTVEETNRQEHRCTVLVDGRVEDLREANVRRRRSQRLQRQRLERVIRLKRDDVHRLVVTSNREVGRPPSSFRHIGDRNTRSVSRQRLALLVLVQRSLLVELKVDELLCAKRNDDLILIRGRRDDRCACRSVPLVDAVGGADMPKASGVDLEETGRAELLHGQRRAGREESSVVDLLDRLAD